MKRRLVLKGKDPEGNAHLFALELHPNESKLHVFSFDTEHSTDEMHHMLINEWRKGEEGAIMPPEGKLQEQPFSITASPIPDTIELEDPDRFSERALEWQLLILSHHMKRQYEEDLSFIQDRIEALTAYDQLLWDELKNKWSQINDNIAGGDIKRHHTFGLKRSVDKMFAQLKQLKSEAYAKQKAAAEEKYKAFVDRIEGINSRMLLPKENLRALFDELKIVQKRVKEADLTHSLRNALWKRLDKTFQAIKEKRFGDKAPEDQAADGRLDGRLKGINSSLDRLQKSLARDKKEIEFQKKRLKSPTLNVMTEQICNTKIQMVEARLASKQKKIDGLLKSQKNVEKQLAKAEAKAAKRAAELEAKTAAKKEAPKQTQKATEVSEANVSTIKTAATPQEVEVKTPEANVEKEVDQEIASTAQTEVETSTKTSIEKTTEDVVSEDGKPHQDETSSEE